MHTKTRLIPFLALFLVSRAALAQPAPTPAPVRSVTTTGEATVYVVPDEVNINVGVSVSSPDLAKAKAEVEGRSKTLLSAVRGAGVPEDQIQTAQIDISMQYDNWQLKQGLQFVATRTYAIKLKDLTKLSTVLDAALTNGANILNGIEYNSSEVRKHRDEARRTAARAAREKAQLLAGELGSSVGQVLTIIESSMSYVPLRMGNALQNAVQADGQGGEADTSLPAGKIPIRASITTTFELK